MKITVDFIPTCIVAFSIQIISVLSIIFRANLCRHTLFDHPWQKLIVCKKKQIQKYDYYILLWYEFIWSNINHYQCQAGSNKVNRHYDFWHTGIIITRVHNQWASWKIFKKLTSIFNAALDTSVEAKPTLRLVQSKPHSSEKEWIMGAFRLLVQSFIPHQFILYHTRHQGSWRIEDTVQSSQNWRHVVLFRDWFTNLI